MDVHGVCPVWVLVLSPSMRSALVWAAPDCSSTDEPCRAGQESGGRAKSGVIGSLSLLQGALRGAPPLLSQWVQALQLRAICEQASSALPLCLPVLVCLHVVACGLRSQDCHIKLQRLPGVFRERPPCHAGPAPHVWCPACAQRCSQQGRYHIQSRHA